MIAASLPIQIHAIIALLLIPLTLTIFLIRRGSQLHKCLGWLWVGGMGIVALSSFAISEIRLIGPFSPIHLLSVVSLGSLVWAIISIRRHNVARHRKVMLGLTYGALITAGMFTLLGPHHARHLDRRLTPVFIPAIQMGSVQTQSFRPPALSCQT